MLRSFIAWLDDYLANEGPSGLARGIVGLLSFAALLGAVMGDVALRAGAILTIILAVLASGLLLLADRRALQRQIQADQKLLVLYSSTLHGMDPGYRITSWDKTIVIAPNGDAIESVTLRATVERSGVRVFYPGSDAAGTSRPGTSERST